MRDPPALLPKFPPSHPSLPSPAAPMGSLWTLWGHTGTCCWLLSPRARCWPMSLRGMKHCDAFCHPRCVQSWLGTKHPKSKDLALALAATSGRCWHQIQRKIFLFFGLFLLFMSVLVLISGLSMLPTLADLLGFRGWCHDHECEVRVPVLIASGGEPFNGHIFHRNNGPS